jgi:carotenoid cleavage dioxygenase
MSQGNPYLEGIFAPIEEETTALGPRVTGSIPRELEGRLLRIGPNPVAADPATHHWFLGNGMAHGLKLSGGEALWYRSRLVRDDAVTKYKGWPETPGPRPEFELESGIVNTNLIQHAGKTLATVEAGNLPMELTEELETVTRTDFGGTLPAGFSAHPKRDPDTGELHAAVYGRDIEHIQYVVVGVDGRVRKSVDVPTPGHPMVHDCSISANYFILLDLPVILDADAIEAGSRLPYRWHPEYGARVGLLPREGAASDVTWHEVDPCFVFHPMNSYEDSDGRVVLDVCRYPRMFDENMTGPFEDPGTLDRWVIDPRGGPVKEERISERGEEFPRHDERLIGKPYRYGYSVGNLGGRAFDGLEKFDLQAGTSQTHYEGRSRTFMEPIFVPRSSTSGEDEGWVMAYVHDADTNSCDVVILESQNFSAPPIATIHLPVRVPYGFHGNWVPSTS